MEVLDQSFSPCLDGDLDGFYMLGLISKIFSMVFSKKHFIQKSQQLIGHLEDFTFLWWLPRSSTEVSVHQPLEIKRGLLLPAMLPRKLVSELDGEQLAQLSSSSSFHSVA